MRCRGRRPCSTSPRSCGTSPQPTGRSPTPSERWTPERPATSRPRPSARRWRGGARSWLGSTWTPHSPCWPRGVGTGTTWRRRTSCAWWRSRATMRTSPCGPPHATRPSARGRRQRPRRPRRRRRRSSPRPSRGAGAPTSMPRASISPSRRAGTTRRSCVPRSSSMRSGTSSGPTSRTCGGPSRTWMPTATGPGSSTWRSLRSGCTTATTCTTTARRTSGGCGRTWTATGAARSAATNSSRPWTGSG
mmetsp:Transcript_370/g.935  ORF Transcript_370/g.935 Transcript_370/m.935 type:complete len:247 (+) Transcript_370:761-1501(+)